MKELGRTLKRWWMKFAEVLGWINTRVILTIVYIVFFGLGAIVLRLFRVDLLNKRRRRTDSYWRAKDPVSHTLEQARHQF